jgi:hypothetical protein
MLSWTVLVNIVATPREMEGEECQRAELVIVRFYDPASSGGEAHTRLQFSARSLHL